MSDTGKIVALVKALAPVADQETVDSAVETYLDNHPEATTTVQDGSITEAKLAQQLAAKIGQISSLSDEIAGLQDVYLSNHSTQYIDHSAMQYGYYTRSGSNIINHPNTQDYLNITVSIPAGSYRYTRIKPEFTFVKTGETVTTFSTENGTFTVNAESELYITVNTAYTDAVMVIDGTAFPIKYTYGAYDISFKSNAFKADIRNCVYVEKDGSGDFTKLADAIAYAQENSNTTIYIGPGVYDIIEELGGSEYTESVTASGRPGLKLGNGMHLIFSSASKVISHYNGTNQYMYSAYSPFNNMIDNAPGFTIENLNLECSNCRYAVHDETTGYAKRYRNVYINCRMRIDNTGNNYITFRQCIGGGLGKNTEIIIDGCYFESVPTQTSPNGTGIVTYHNTTGTNANDNIRSNIVIKNSYFANDDTVKVSYLGQQTEKSTALVSGCSLGMSPYVQDEASGSAVNMVLYTAANEIR